MTSPLRMKRRTTHRARTMWARTAASWLACCLAVSGHALGKAGAGELPPPPLPAVPSVPVDAPPIGAPAVSAPLAEAPVWQPTVVVTDGPAGEKVTTAIFTREPVKGAAAEQGDIQQVGQETPFRLKDRSEDTYDITASTELPGPERLFRRQSEKDFFERVREDYRGIGGGRIIFPKVEPLTTEKHRLRQFPPRVRGVEPNYVCHGRLLFEQPYFERQGWDLGILTPICNLSVYYYDLALLPYHAWTRPVQLTDCLLRCGWLFARWTCGALGAWRAVTVDHNLQSATSASASS